MAGKRLLDAAKLFNAAKSIGKQHVTLQQEQWDVYSKTSSLAKAAKNQTDRVTVTASAAYELAKRLNETGPSWKPSQTSEAPPQENYDSTSGLSAEKARAFDRSRSQGVVASTTQQGVLPEFASQHNILRPRDLNNEKPYLAQERAAQTRTEEQSPIARVGAQAPSEQRKHLDSFNVLTDGVPKEAEIVQRSNSRDLNGDTERDGHQITDNHTHFGEEQLPEGTNIDGLFSSRRISREVGKTGPNIKNPYGDRKKLPPKPLPEMVKAEEERKKQQAEPSSSRPLNSKSVDSADVEVDPETQRLAESIAQESEAQSSSLPNSGEQSIASETPYEMHESRVPSSRFGRLLQYGSLATSMAFGAVGEGFRRFAGGTSQGSLMMSEGNMNRLVAKLSRMRGAALKLGQMVSFQDSKLLPPTINTILQRVQDSADYMPPSQRDKVLTENLGQSWRDLFSHFEEKPFAAASIGQVHKAVLASNGEDVAVKVQYPGVRNSIDSDLNNLALLLTASRLLPKGLFLEKTIDNARVELAWECDYEREAQACIRFKQLLEEENNIFQIPTIYTEASGPGVLTAEFMTGTAVTKMRDLSQQDRDWVGTQILRLCLRELMEWRFMQTDPNWTNFLYNRESQKLELLDFGASREFPDKFVEPYVSLLIAASKGDKDRCRDLSIELGYLTGQEGRDMLKAHVDSIMTLAEPFVESAPEVYDFEDQTITDRVRANIGLMLQERLAPPPEETYSLHRKLSGSFLLCARLRSRVRARDMFARAVEVWNGGENNM